MSSSRVAEVVLGRVVGLRVLVEVAEVVVLVEAVLVSRSSRFLVGLLPSSLVVSSSWVVEVVLGAVVELRVVVEVVVEVVSRAGLGVVVVLEEVGDLVLVEQSGRSSSPGSSSSLVLLEVLGFLRRVVLEVVLLWVPFVL